MKFESKFNVGDKVIAKDSLDGIVKSISFDGNKFTYLIAADYSSVCSMQFYNEEELKMCFRPNAKNTKPDALLIP